MALLDFGGFVVHVFSEQARRYYDLERLWRMAPKLDIPTGLKVLLPYETCLIRPSGRNTFPAKPFPAGRTVAVRGNDRGTIAVDHRRPRIAPSI